MDGSITPSFIEEAAILVERFEPIQICFRSEPFKVADLEIRPLFELISNMLYELAVQTYKVAVVIGLSTIVTQEPH
jgi:hypothetical protein